MADTVKRRIQTALGALLFAGLSTPAAIGQVAAAARSADGAWAVVRAGGCSVVLSTESEWQAFGAYSENKIGLAYSWQGGCDADGLANGDGVLTLTYVRPPQDWSPEPVRLQTDLLAHAQGGLFQGRAESREISDAQTPGGVFALHDAGDGRNPRPVFYRDGCAYNTDDAYGPAAPAAEPLFGCNPAAGLAFRNQHRGHSRADAAVDLIRLPVPPASWATQTPAQLDLNASLRQRAERGDVAAQAEIGRRLSHGGYTGVKENMAEALRWLRLAVQAGNADAQYRLGSMFNSGDGVTRDSAEALRLYRLAAAQGHARAREDVEYNAEQEARRQREAAAARAQAAAAAAAKPSPKNVLPKDVKAAVLQASERGVPRSECLIIEEHNSPPPPPLPPAHRADYDYTGASDGIYNPKTYEPTRTGFYDRRIASFRNVCQEELYVVIVACVDWHSYVSGEHRGSNLINHSMLVPAAPATGGPHYLEVTRLDQNGPNNPNVSPREAWRNTRSSLSQIAYGAWTPGVRDTQEIWRFFGHRAREVYRAAYLRVFGEPSTSPSWYDSYARHKVPPQAAHHVTNVVNSCTTFPAAEMARVWERTPPLPPGAKAD